MKAVAHKALFRALRPESGIRLMPDGLQDCPRCGRSYGPAVKHCSGCEEAPEPPDAEDPLPGERLPPMDQYDDDFREGDYDGGLGDPTAMGRLKGMRG